MGLPIPDNLDRQAVKVKGGPAAVVGGTQFGYAKRLFFPAKNGPKRPKTQSWPPIRGPKSPGWTSWALKINRGRVLAIPRRPRPMAAYSHRTFSENLGPEMDPISSETRKNTDFALQTDRFRAQRTRAPRATTRTSARTLAPGIQPSKPKPGRARRNLGAKHRKSRPKCDFTPTPVYRGVFE